MCHLHVIDLMSGGVDRPGQGAAGAVGLDTQQSRTQVKKALQHLLCANSFVSTVVTVQHPQYKMITATPSPLPLITVNS